jgi:hypothetical protein
MGLTLPAHPFPMTRTSSKSSSTGISFLLVCVLPLPFLCPSFFTGVISPNVEYALVASPSSTPGVRPGVKRVSVPVLGLWVE